MFIQWHSAYFHSALYPSFRRKNPHWIFRKLPVDNFPHSAFRKIPLPWNTSGLRYQRGFAFSDVVLYRWRRRGCDGCSMSMVKLRTVRWSTQRMECFVSLLSLDSTVNLVPMLLSLIATIHISIRPKFRCVLCFFYHCSWLQFLHKVYICILSDLFRICLWIVIVDSLFLIGEENEPQSIAPNVCMWEMSCVQQHVWPAQP